LLSRLTVGKAIKRSIKVRGSNVSAILTNSNRV
jgi:hypothetical protein